jgi:hypothetical protein
MRGLGMWTADAPRWNKDAATTMWSAIPAPNTTNVGPRPPVVSTCLAALRSICSSEISSECFSCVGEHFSALASARCTTAEVDAYCS